MSTTIEQLSRSLFRAERILIVEKNRKKINPTLNYLRNASQHILTIFIFLQHLVDEEIKKEEYSVADASPENWSIHKVIKTFVQFGQFSSEVQMKTERFTFANMLAYTSFF